MQIVAKTLLASVVLLVLLAGGRPPPAAADGCTGCTTNSPIVNPFPIGGLRWGTAKVKEGTPRCVIQDSDEAALAIAEIAPGSKLRGYQLVVVDKQNRQLCAGTSLTGVKFVISKDWEPYVVQQIAKTELKQDLSQLDRPDRKEEFRLVYYIAAAADPDESICIDERRWANRRHKRLLRRVIRREGPSFADYPPPKVSDSLNDVFKVLEGQLDRFAVVIPDAAYTIDGISRDPGANLDRTKLRSVPSAKLEWFELACAGGALAHTELSGLVEMGEDKKVRTAALRMFLAKYQDDNDTVEGVPIEYVKHATLAIPGKLPPGTIEAQWNENGATCLSHSRMWRKDTLITEGIYYQGMSLDASETEFIKEYKLKKCSDRPAGYFTSFVVNHVH